MTKTKETPFESTGVILIRRLRPTVMSFPSFSGLFASFIAAAAAAPDDIPTCKKKNAEIM